MEENKLNLSEEDVKEISILTDTLKDMEGELLPVDMDELSALMQTSDDDILVEPRITEFHDLSEALVKKPSGPKFTSSQAKQKQKRKNKQKQAKKSRKINR
jgi:secreted protein with Ig-like and vWFA domain